MGIWSKSQLRRRNTGGGVRPGGEASARPAAHRVALFLYRWIPGQPLAGIACTCPPKGSPPVLCPQITVCIFRIYAIKVADRRIGLQNRLLASPLVQNLHCWLDTGWIKPGVSCEDSEEKILRSPPQLSQHDSGFEMSLSDHPRFPI